MECLKVRVVKARNLPVKDVTGSLGPYVAVRLGNYKERTRHFEKKSNPEWNQVFALSKESIQASVLEVTVKEKGFVKNDYIGRVMFDLNEISNMVPSDCSLAPQWYRLDDKNGNKLIGELLLAVWMGTQADETFPEECHLDAAAVNGDMGCEDIRSKVYFSPKLWYLRVNVIEAWDLILSDKIRFPVTPSVKGVIGNQEFWTKVSMSKTILVHREDMVFVVAEPFDEPLILSLVDKSTNTDDIIGCCVIPLSYVDRRLDNKPVASRWYALEKHVIGGEKKQNVEFVSKIHARICLEGGYHVLDESTQYSGDLRPSAKQLWKSGIGVLELGILNAQGLSPMKRRDGRVTTDAYCVAKYGHKWVRTRTITDSLTPKWNEHYTWEVFDPCTVITVVVFDNCQLQGEEKSEEAKDSRIGKVRIRLSTLETDRVYKHCYPLLVLHHTGVKQMGKIYLAVRFICPSLLSMVCMYSQPLLPKMHYVRPFKIYQLDLLRNRAVKIVSMRLSRAEPPLRKEVVEYMLDVGSDMWSTLDAGSDMQSMFYVGSNPSWSMRRSKANFSRIMSLFWAAEKRFAVICNWKDPIATVVVHIVFILVLIFPKYSLTIILLYISLVGAWNYKWKPSKPPDNYTHLSCTDTAFPDELYEEFDTFPTSSPPAMVSMRYDRLRIVAVIIQNVVGDLATQLERLESLQSYRDPRATILFLIFCLVASFVFYHVSPQVVLALTGFYVLRHPCFRHKHPTALLNFLGRIPTKTDCMLWL